MRGRITAAIVGVAALILVALGIPLAVAVHHWVLGSEVVELQATAARTLTEVAVPFDLTQLAAVAHEPDAPPPFGVYDGDGALVFGDGPLRGDEVVGRALAGVTVTTTHGQIVVATPIHLDTAEQIVGVLRVSESLDGVNRRSRFAWMIMAIAGAAALAVGWLIARRLAERLSRPVIDLASAAARVRDGGVLEWAGPSGVGEIDALAAVLVDGSQRVSDALTRERRFSADVSHQLRTPLTGLRLRLESMRARSESGDAIDAALSDLARVESTVEHLLAFARDASAATGSLQLDVAARDAAERWGHRVRTAGRTVVVEAPDAIATVGSTVSVEQMLDVLIDNALRHGRGTIRVTARRMAGGGAINVSDEGDTITEHDEERIFRRHHGAHTGIGLALARSIAEVDGGRLLLTNRHPTTFSVILLDTDRLDGGGTEEPVATVAPAARSSSTPATAEPARPRR